MLTRIVVLAGPAAALAALAVPMLVLSGRLPDPLATHWTVDGRPDGRTGIVVLSCGLGLVIAAAWGVLAVQAARRRREGTRLTAAPWVWGLSGSVVAIGLLTVAANLDAGSWADADPVGFWIVPVMLIAGGAPAWLAHRLERHRPVAPPGERAANGRPTVGLAPGEHAVWTAQLASAPAAAAAVGAAVALPAAGWTAGGAAGWALLAAGLVVAAAIATVSEVTAIVDARGLTVAHGPLGRPRRTIALRDIAAAEAVDVDPWRVGGWGVRKVPGRGGATAIVVRGGPGLRIVRTDGRELVVTVPDPGTGAGLLADLAAREGRRTDAQPGSTSWPPAKSWASRT